MLTLHRKSQIVIEHCWTSHEDKPDRHIFWVEASSERSLVKGYREIAEELHLASSKDDDVAAVQRVYRWFKDEANLPWLFVLDSADDLNTLSGSSSSPEGEDISAFDYLPLELPGTVIVITRDARVASRMVPPQNHIRVPALPADEARELLCSRTIVSDSSLDTAASQLVEQLEYLPIAIIQAAVYINENNTTAAEYLENFRTSELERRDLLSRGFGGNRHDSEMKDSLMWSWRLSYDIICERYPMAAKIAAILGVMSCDHVPIKALHKSSGESWASLVDAIGTLQSFSFLAQTSQSGFVQVHRLFHLCIQKWLDMNGMTDHWRQEALNLLAEHHPGPTGDHRLGKALDPHVHVLLKSANDFRDQAQYVDLLRKAGNFDRTQGNSELADERLQQARTILEDQWGPDHILTLATYNELGMIACDLGEFAEAEEYHSKAEKGYKKLHGPDHPDYLHVLVNIGFMHKEKGHPQKAENHFRQALAVYEKTHGHDHHLTLQCGCHIATSLYKQNKFIDAEAVLRRVLVRQERLLGDEHPHTLESNQVLALALVGQKSQYEEAERRQRGVFEVYQRTHGMHHVATWDSLDHLGTVLRFQGKYDEALTLYLNIFDEVHRTLGPEHQDTLRFQNHIADVYYEQGDYVNAERYFRQVMDEYARFDTEHLDTLLATGNVAASLRGQGRLQEAEEMQRDVLQRWENGFGADDDKTLRCLLSLSETIARQARLEDAMEMNRNVHQTLVKIKPLDDLMLKECEEKYRELLRRKEDITDVADDILHDLESLNLDTVSDRNPRP